MIYLIMKIKNIIIYYLINIIMIMTTIMMILIQNHIKGDKEHIVLDLNII